MISEVTRWKVKICSKHSSNKEKKIGKQSHIPRIEIFIPYNNAKMFLPNSHLGSRGRNLQATGCDLWSMLEPSAITWYSSPPSRPTPSEAKGVAPMISKSKVFTLWKKLLIIGVNVKWIKTLTMSYYKWIIITTSLIIQTLFMTICGNWFNHKNAEDQCQWIWSALVYKGCCCGLSESIAMSHW